MADKKKTFVMYESWGAAISMMNNEQAGSLLKSIYEYQSNPDARPDDPAVAFVFEIIRQKMDEDQRKYEETCQARSEAGRRGGKSNAKQTEANKANASFAKQNETNQADTESDTDSDNESESDSENETGNEHPAGAKKKKSAQARPVRHKHGEFGHVLLTDDDLARLNDKHGEDATRAAIKAVDEYCEQSGRTYKNYALVMEKWGYRSAAENARSGTPKKQGGYVDAINHRFDAVGDWLEASNDT